MARVQLALNVNDIDEAVSFYTKLFGTGPAKRKPGYANFAIDQPQLKLVLLENPGQGGTLITRRIYGLSPGKRRIVGLYQAVSLTRLVRTLSS